MRNLFNRIAVVAFVLCLCGPAWLTGEIASGEGTSSGTAIPQPGDEIAAPSSDLSQDDDVAVSLGFVDWSDMLANDDAELSAMMDAAVARFVAGP